MDIADQKGDAYYGIAWHSTKFLCPISFRSDLFEMGLLDDLKQEVRLSAWESRQLGEDIKSASNRAQRGVYRFLVNSGWKRPRGSSRYVPEFEQTKEEEKECMTDKI